MSMGLSLQKKRIDLTHDWSCTQQIAFIDLPSISPTTVKTFREAKTIRAGEKGCLFDWETSKLLDVIILFLYFTTKYLNSISRPLPCIPEVFSLPATKRIKRSEVLKRGKKNLGFPARRIRQPGYIFYLFTPFTYKYQLRNCDKKMLPAFEGNRLRAVFDLLTRVPGEKRI